MTYRLACGADPVALGIEDADGSWSLAALEEHVQQCPTCQRFADRIRGRVRTTLERRARRRMVSIKLPPGLIDRARRAADAERCRWSWHDGQQSTSRRGESHDGVGRKE